MPVGNLSSEADLSRFVENLLMEKYGVVHAHRIAGLPDALAGHFAWEDWTPNYTGFSADPTNTVSRFIQLGKLVIATHREATAGTSNATTFTISAPVAAATITNAQWHVAASVTDNGVALTTPGVVVIASAGTVFQVFSNSAAAAFTAAGGKRVSAFTLIYEAA